MAFYEEVSGKWIQFGSGPFDREGRPGGCGWVLTYSDRLVEERGCFQDGKREGTWETCPMRLGLDGSTTPLSACEETEYRAGAVFVKPKEPEPEENPQETATKRPRERKTAARAKRRLLPSPESKHGCSRPGLQIAFSGRPECSGDDKPAAGTIALRIVPRPIEPKGRPC